MRLLNPWWRAPRFVWGLFVVEFILTVPLLALFGIAQPNTYRTKLWQEGADHGWNSNPNEILYSYANHNPIDPPLIWRSFITKYNVVISIFAMFLLLTKTTMMVMHVFWPPLSVLIHLALIALFAFSTYAQTSHDTTDPQHKQTGAPWYITKSCSVASTSSIRDYCKQAKAAFALTVIMMAIFVIHLVWAVWSNFTGKKPYRPVDEDDEAPKVAVPKNKEYGSPQSAVSNEQQWEMNDLRGPGGQHLGSQGVPYTPRTQAFHALGGGSGDLPLRQQ